jgi:predicted PurR-regulated permease PerM
MDYQTFQEPSLRFNVAAWILAAAALVAVLVLRLLPALLAGLLVHQLVHVLAARIPPRLAGSRAKWIAVLLLSAIIIALLSSLIIGGVAFFRSDAGSLPMLLQKLAEIIESSRDKLPAWMVERLPVDAEAIRSASVTWLREHAGELQGVGKEAGRLVAHLLIGMVLGALLALREAGPPENRRPLALALSERALRLGEAFRRVVFAQLRIAALNTIFTGFYLSVALPLAGIQLPLKKTLIAVTFITGLLPVVGNLISNTVIVIVSLSYSLPVAIASLVFLIVIHKLEYFLNARIVGSQIHSRAWEILLAMLFMEAAFGLGGVVAAPIFYAYLKAELSAKGLV